MSYRPALVVSLALALIAACGGRQARDTATDAPRVALKAPSLHGGTIDIERYRGQVVVVHLFAPAEPEVARDVEKLKALHREPPQDEVAVIGVALEPGGYAVVSAWRRAMEADYLMALVTDPSELHSAGLAPLTSLPTTLVIDPRGRLTHRVDRPLRRGELAQLVAPLLANAPGERPPP